MELGILVGKPSSPTGFRWVAQIRSFEEVCEASRDYFLCDRPVSYVDIDGSVHIADFSEIVYFEPQKAVGKLGGRYYKMPETDIVGADKRLAATIVDMAYEAFRLDDYIMGVESDAAPRKVTDVILGKDGTVSILFFKDGISYTAAYKLFANKQFRIKTTKGWTEKIFEYSDNSECVDKVQAFCNKYRLTGSVMQNAA